MGVYDGSRTYTDGPGLVELAITLAGRPDEVIRYWTPAIEPRFQSPLVNDDNFAYGCADCAALADRVARRLKPLAFAEGLSADQRRAADVVRVAGGHAVLEDYGRPDYGGVTLAIDGVVGETFDLDALLADYAGYLAAAQGPYPDLLGAIADELARLAPLRFADLMEFGQVEVSFTDPVPTRRFRRRPETLVRCGLLLGYPIASTAALILGDHALPGGYTNY